MASYHFSFGNPEEAVKLYNQLLDEAPYTLDFWHNLIRCYIRMYQSEKAMEAIDFAMAIDDTNLITWELKSNCLLLENEIDQALECLFYIEKHTTEKPYIQNIRESVCTLPRYWLVHLLYKLVLPESVQQEAGYNCTPYPTEENRR